jgi:catechol 2,3-dioxygenase-like lactoylglutathione lyase family enzyme
MPATVTAAGIAVRFHVGLNVTDLERSVRFYRVLFGTGPAKHFDDYAKFESDRPPLVLALYPGSQQPGGALNHVGLRLPDAVSLVEVQRRLEQAGIATQRQEGVECCYARQTKFWVTDPDRVLWEIYTLEADIDHSGFDDPPAPAEKPAEAVWEHRLIDVWLDSVPHPDASLDLIRLEGSFNADVPADRLSALLADVYRALKPGGAVAVRGLVGDKPFPGKPALPGLASLVQRVPVETEALEALERAGFGGLFYEKLGDIHCFTVNGVELREMRLHGRKPAGDNGVSTVTVLYKGPFESVADESGAVYRRGEAVRVSAARAGLLRRGPAAEQFAFL